MRYGAHHDLVSVIMFCCLRATKNESPSACVSARFVPACEDGLSKIVTQELQLSKEPPSC